MENRPEEELVPVAVTSGMSGDPLLKRLVDLAHLGWTARLVLFSNGELLSGDLISPAQFRAALAASIRGRGGSEGPLAGLDIQVAAVIDAEDPPVPELALSTVPEPRFIHLANVRRIEGGAAVPFMRFRLPAVSGFWVEPAERRRDEDR